MTNIISVVSYPFLPARTGGERGIALFYKYFSRYHRVLCITTQKNDPRAAAGYEVWNILSNSPLRYINPFYFIRMCRIIRQQKATHLILEHPYYGWLGVLLKWTCRVKLVIHSHNLEGLRWKTLGKWWWKILWGYEKWVHRQADYNFFIQDEDRQYALRHFSLAPSRCITMTYGFEKSEAPAPADIQQSRDWLRKEYGIREDESVLFFNGAFNYFPNLNALQLILDTINPLLLQSKDFAYKILICGKDIPAEILTGSYPNVIFAGFVADIDAYFKGADIFINPVIQGGGIKTKLVEALGNNLTAVSVRNGAIGIDPAWCNGKLLISEDHDWEQFVKLIRKAGAVKTAIPSLYFEHFYWGYTTREAAAFIEGNKGDKT
jgi:glycosyl transferase family 1/glycosyl transferase family 4